MLSFLKSRALRGAGATTATATAGGLAGAVIAVLIAGAEPAHAQLSPFAEVPLAQVLVAASGTARLQIEVRVRLLRARLKREQVTCQATVLGANWVHLAGRTLAPYQCPMGSRMLLATSTPRYRDAGGRVLALGDPELAAKATSMSETRFRWSWERR